MKRAAAGARTFNFYFSDGGAQGSSPAGILFLSRALKDAGWKTNMRAFEVLGGDKFSRHVNETKPDAAGITLDMYNLGMARSVFGGLKQFSEATGGRIMRVVGGPETREQSRAALSKFFFEPDGIFSGDSVRELPDFLDGKTVPMDRFMTAEEFSGLELDFDILVEYFKASGQPKTAYFPTSLGCIHKCFYCPEPQVGIREFTIDKVIALLQEFASKLKQHGMSLDGGFFFTDPSLNRNVARFKELMERIISSGLNKVFRFGGYGNVENFFRGGDMGSRALDAEQFRLMKRANFDGLFLGIESFDESELKGLGRAWYTPEEAITVFKELHKHGISPSIGLIAFNPKSTARGIGKSMIAEVNLMAETGVHYVSVNGLIPHPSTPSWNRLIQRYAGKVPPNILLMDPASGQPVKKPSYERFMNGEYMMTRLPEDPLNPVVAEAMREAREKVSRHLGADYSTSGILAGSMVALNAYMQSATEAFLREKGVADPKEELRRKLDSH